MLFDVLLMKYKGNLVGILGCPPLEQFTLVSLLSQLKKVVTNGVISLFDEPFNNMAEEEDRLRRDAP